MANGATAQWSGARTPTAWPKSRSTLPQPSTSISRCGRERRSSPGDAAAPPPALPSPERREAAQNGWLRFARRDGSIRLDVAALGERVAPGFPAELWVRATRRDDAGPVAGVAIALDRDTSLTLGPTAPTAGTDSRGWVRVVTTPVGLAVTVTLRARSPDGRAGEWIGGLFMSPGAPRVERRAPREDPGAEIAIDVTMPTARSAAYVEIDDARGGRGRRLRH